MNRFLVVIRNRALGVAALCVYALGAVVAVFPYSPIGHWGYLMIETGLGVSIATIVACAVMHLVHSLATSLVRWRRSQNKSWAMTWVSDDSLPSKIATGSLYVFVFCLVVLFWIAVIGFAVHIVSFGRLGYLPTGKGFLSP